MTKNENNNEESVRSFLQGPSDETLREARTHDNGDLTIRSEAGEIRLINGTDGWKRYTGYLKVRNIEPTVEET
jgi:hypothetical protein